MTEILAVTHRAVAKNLFAEGCFLSSQVQQLLSLTTFLLLHKSLKPWLAACRLLCNKCPSTGAVRSTQSTPYASSKSFLILNCRDQNPKGKGDFCLRLYPDLILACSNFFFFTPHTLHTTHFPNASLSEQQMTLTAVEICKTTAALGDEKVHFALCQVSAVILPYCNLNPLYKTTLSPSQKLSYSQQISQGQTLNQDKLLSAPAKSVIYNNLHGLIISHKYHLLQNSSALLQMKTVQGIFFPQTRINVINNHNFSKKANISLEA